MKKTEQQIKNCLMSELYGMISEFELGQLNKEIILGYFTEFLLDANVDSDIVISVLEDDRFGIEGKEQARCIKVAEGR